MILKSEKAALSGTVEIPASKSHTIRALAFATLATGQSTIRNPLESADTLSCVSACRALGAKIETGEEWLVDGVAGRPRASESVIDVGNSGTTLYVALGMAALSEGTNVFTGDEQVRRRSAENLLNALNDLGASATSERGDGCAPITVRGRLRGGETSIACPTSQYLTSLLISAPLAEGDSRINVTLLNEEPYVCITLDWMDRFDMQYSQEGLRTFHIPGGQSYDPFTARVAGDFSSATFFLCAAAITGADLLLNGLDINDPQGDKAVVGMLKQMGAQVESRPLAVRIKGGALKGCDLDLNATPDALPAMAITACFAEGTTRLLNVPQARIKETDRITVMCEVINALGGKAEELPAGLVVHGTGLRGGRAPGHGDHRVVMACGVAGLVSDSPVEVDTAEAMSITFPSFVDLMNQCGGRMRTAE
jgi:3-phosphoshikimate 1-carboxyvinyltransferase